MGAYVYRCERFRDTPPGQEFNCVLVGIISLRTSSPTYIIEPMAGGGIRQGARAVSEEEISGKTCEGATKDGADFSGITSRPVVITTGAKILPEVDFAMGNVFPLGIGRNYYSTGTEAGAFGRGWSSSIDYGLVFYQGTQACSAASHLASGCTIDLALTTKIVSKRPGGGAFSFLKSTGGSWTSQVEGFEISEIGGGGFAVVKASDSTVETYNALGQTTSIRNENGIGWNFNYSSNVLGSIEHTAGQSMSFTWTGGRISQVSSAGMGAYNYTYSGQGYLLTVTSPIGVGQTQKTYHYEVSGKPWLLTGYSINGVRETRYAYDSNGRATESGLEGGGDKSTFTYGAGFTRVTNALGQQKTYHIGADGRIQSIERPATSICPTGSTTSTYNATTNVTTEVDSLGNRTRYFYSTLGTLLQKNSGETDTGDTSQSQITIYDWNSSETRLLGVREYGATVTAEDFIRETVYQYYPSTDPLKAHYLSQVVVHDRTPGGSSRAVSYNYTFHENRSVKERLVDGPLRGDDDTTIYRYSSSGLLQSITNAAGHITHLSAHNSLGKPGSMMDANGLITDITYDARGRMLTSNVRAPGGDRVTSFEYDEQDNITRLTDSSGRVVDYQRNRAGKVTQMVAAAVSPYGPDGKDIRHLNYNNLGQLTSQSTRQSYLKMVIVGYENGEPIMDYVLDSVEFSSKQWTYDTGGLPASELGNNGQNLRFAYNSNGKLASATDSLNNVTSATYDTHGRVKSVSRPGHGPSYYEYSPLGWLTKVTDAKGSITTYTYNGHGNIVSVSSPDSGSTTYTYDLAGRTMSSTRADGTSTTLSRDILGRVTRSSTTWAAYHGPVDPLVYDFTYDCTFGIGRLCSFTDGTDVTTYSYLKSGEIVSQSSTVAGVTLALSFTYDGVGRLRTASYPGDIVLRYSYNLNHQVERIEARVSGVWRDVVGQAVYQPFGGPLVGLGHGNSLNRQIDYDLDGRITKIYGSGGTHPQNLTYSYNANDQIIGIVNGKNSTFSQTYGYNAAGELATASSTSTGLHSWLHDANGNRTSHSWGGGSDTYTFTPGSNRLMSISGARSRSTSLDANGNMLTETRGGVTVSRKFNGQNRLVEISRPVSQTLAQPNGLTLALPSGTWRYTYNALGQRTSKLHVNSGSVTRYLYGADNVLLGETNAGSTNLDSIYVWLHGRPVGLIRSGVIYAIHSDHLGRPEVVTNSVRSVVWRSNNQAFDRAVSTDLIGGLNIGLPGQQYDAEAGTWYNVFRDYDASVGRYLTSDPIGMSGGLNPYTYVGGNPVSKIDPLGLDECDVAIAEQLMNDYFPADAEMNYPSLSQSSFADLNVGNTSRMIDHAVTNKLTSRVVFDSRYEGSLTPTDAINFLDTYVHESHHLVEGRLFGATTGRGARYEAWHDYVDQRSADFTGLLGDEFLRRRAEAACGCGQ